MTTRTKKAISNIAGAVCLTIAALAAGQSYTPQNFVAYLWDGTGWVRAVGTGTPATGLYPPAGAALFCVDSSGNLVKATTSGNCFGGSGSGTVTAFSAANLAPLFTTSVANSTTTPALSFVLSNAAQNSIFAGPPSGGAGSPSYQTAPTFSLANATGLPAAQVSVGALANGMTATTQSQADNSTKVATTQYVDTKVRQWSCQPGIGDGLNAITAGTYLQSTCYNTTGVTVTLTGLSCFTDNSGSSTMNAAGNTLGALLTGAVTCTSSFAAGTQSANVALTSGDYIKSTFVADGTSKQSTWVVKGTY
jgi:hypothetical protein